MLRFVISLALPAILPACSCMTGSPPCEAAWKASAVFLGTVAELSHERREADAKGLIQANGFLGTHARFEVVEPFIGMEGRGKEVAIRTGMGGGDCGYSFKAGQSYLVYAYESKDGILVATICSRTAPENQAHFDLIYLRSLRGGLQSGFISGVAADGNARPHYDPALRLSTQTGLSGVKVTLTGQDKNESLITGEDGLFRFDQLNPGKYHVAVSKKNYSVQYGSSEVEVHAGGCAFAQESLVLDRRIVGQVVAADGMPGTGIQVQMVPIKPDQPNQLPFPVAEAKTDSNGNYELKDLRPGTYYLGINLSRTPSKDMPYTRYFYPGSEALANAGFVTIGEEAETKTYDFPIPPKQRERKVEGFVFWPDGRPAEKVGIMLKDVRWPWQTNSIAAFTEASGHFVVTAFDDTRYRIHAITMARFTNDSVSAEPMVLDPGTDLRQPLKLILRKKGHSASELTGKGLERWRSGLGL